MKEVLDSYIGYLIGLAGFLSFLFTNLSTEVKLIISFFFSTLYFLSYSLWLQRKHDLIIKKQVDKEELLKKKEAEIDRHREFIHKRKLFIKHDFPGIIRISKRDLGYLKNKYRGQRFKFILEDFELSQRDIEEIINKEMRDFDEQLFHIQSDKDN